MFRFDESWKEGRDLVWVGFGSLCNETKFAGPDEIFDMGIKLKNKEPSIEFIVCCHHRAMQLCANAMTEEEGPIYQTMGKNNPVIQGMCTWGSGNHEYFIR